MEKNIDLRYYFETIKAYLIESTNIVPLFKKDGISLETFDIHKILLNIKGCSNDEILERFLDGVNNEYGIRKKFKKFNMNVIIYSNINYKLEKNPNFITYAYSCITNEILMLLRKNYIIVTIKI